MLLSARRQIRCHCGVIVTTITPIDTPPPDEQSDSDAVREWLRDHARRSDTRGLPVVVGCNGSRCGSDYTLGVYHQMCSGKVVASSEASSERLGRADVSELAGARGLGRSQARLPSHAVRLDQ